MERSNVQEHFQNETEFTSEFSYLFKSTGKNKLSQEERREMLLKDQKEKRHNIVDKHRDFSELFLEDDERMSEMSEVTEEFEEMEVDIRNKRRSRFILMQSEWFTEIPADLEQNWLIKLAPDGFRVLVIAKKHHTIILNQRGVVLRLKTHLPGGGLCKGFGLTVLDCIYNKATKTIFVLDCLYWNTMSMLDSESTFRFYWIKNQFSDNCRLVETSKAHKFYVLDFFPAEKSLIQEKLYEQLIISSQNILYTGIVFYHKELHYMFGQTPLLGWLYTYMLPEKLSIDVPKELACKMPKEYENLEKYLECLEKKQSNKHRYYRNQRQLRKTMDTS